jgi:hypothetical protein
MLRESHTQERGGVKEVKKVHKVDVLPIKNEYRSFKPVEITKRRGM